YLTLVFGTPHYGATLLRVYRSAEDRRAYRIFTVHATWILFALFAIGVHQPLVGSLILTLYLTWSPWHYTGQNYGIAVMLLRKRGAAPPAGLKRILYLSFFFSFLLTFLGQHSGGDGATFVPLSYAGAGYGFLPIGFPDPLASWAIAGVAVAYVATFVVAAAGLVRAGGLGACAPALVLMASQSLWFSIPLLARHWHLGQQYEPLAAHLADYYFLWVAVAHSVQYLWVTSYYARSEGDRAGLAGYSLRALLAGALIWTLPAFVFAPDLLGRLPFDAGLGILVASTVNLHHFILDGAIWKLRDGRVARILLRPREAAADAPIGPQGAPWRAGLLWGLGALCVVLLFYGRYETGVAEDALRRRDAGGATAALERLRWMGLDHAEGRRALGQLLSEQGREDQAGAEFERSLELRPSAAAWQAMAGHLARSGDLPGAAAAYEQALAAAPDEDVLHYEAGLVYLKLGELERARDAFERAANLNPKRGINRRMLEQVEAQLAEAS
ncbi:MAG TPA: tetratricopeptide repeat protein, partial [Myxococcota bacterium]|nr:tetratricopeptide repeat protein [Myxococcota bacterium]